MPSFTSLVALVAASSLVAAMPSGHLAARATPDEINQYLAGHNNERANHGANALVWDDQAAAKAQQWADRCVFEHSGGQLGSYGGWLSYTLTPCAVSLTILQRTLLPVLVVDMTSPLLSSPGTTRPVTTIPATPNTPTGLRSSGRAPLVSVVLLHTARTSSMAS